MKYNNQYASIRSVVPTIIFGLAVAVGCSAESFSRRSTLGGNGGGRSSSAGASGNSTLGGYGGASTTGAGTSTAQKGDEPESWPPSECKTVITIANNVGAGAYCQGPALKGQSSDIRATVQNDSDCGKTLWGITRDFVGYYDKGTTGTPHPDFGTLYCCGNPKGTVLPDLGADGKPAYNPANVTGDYSPGGVGLTGKEYFDQWYRDVPGINLPFLSGFYLVPSGDGKTSVFNAKYYFPVDNEGFGNDASGEDGKPHNFGFTTELHTKFKYQGGEIFAFEGDDDLWVFINGKLAIDLGGIHVAMMSQIALDDKAKQLGIQVGEVYRMDLFQAERHPSGSQFKMTTSMTFVDCGIDPVLL